MALAAGSLVFQVFAKDDPLGTALGTLTNAYDKHVVIEDNGIGHGGFTIHPDDTGASWCEQDAYVACWRDTVSGSPLAGFWIDAVRTTVSSTDEKGGEAIAVNGRGPIAILEEAEVWPRAVSGASGQVRPRKGDWLWRNVHPATVLIRMLEEASARGVIAGVTWDFSRLLDSDGNAWTADPAKRYTLRIGTDLLTVVRELRETGLHIEMDAGLVVHAWDTKANDLSGTIGFTAGVDIRDSSDIDAIARRGKSTVVVEGENRAGSLRYRIVHDATIQTALGRRKEGYFQFGRTASGKVLKRVGTRKLTRWKRQHDGPFTLGVIDTTGKVALVDYGVGDTVAVPTAYVASGSERISSVSLREIEDGTYDPTLEFGDLATDPVTGSTPSGDIEGAGCCGGSAGTGPKPGGGTGEGGPSDPGGPSGGLDVSYHLIDGFDRTPPEVGAVETETSGTEHVVALPDGSDAPDRTIVLLCVYTDPGNDTNLGSILATMAWANGAVAAVNMNTYAGTYRLSVAKRILDGGEGYPNRGATLTITTPSSVSMLTRAILLDGIIEMDGAQAASADPPNVPAIATASDDVRYFTFGADATSISGEPTGYTNESSGAASGSRPAWRISKRDGDGTAEDPSTYTSAGGSPGSITVGLLAKLDGSLSPVGQFGIGHQPTQEVTGSAYKGGVRWAPMIVAATYSLDAGSLVVTGTTTGDNFTFNLTNSDAPLTSAEYDGPDTPLLSEYQSAYLDFDIDVIGNPAHTGERYFRLHLDNGETEASIYVRLGDGTYAEGLLLTDVAVDDFQAVSIDVTETYRLKWEWDQSNDRIRAKLWKLSTAEPDWQVSGVPDPSDLALVSLGGILGNDSGAPMVLRIDHIYAADLAAPGDFLARHFLGYADGTATYSTEFPFTEGTLAVWVDNDPADIASENGAGSSFTLTETPYDDPADSTGSQRIDVAYERDS